MLAFNARRLARETTLRKRLTSAAIRSSARRQATTTRAHEAVWQSRTSAKPEGSWPPEVAAM
eukprot:5619851-Alexandrium_andersonii.AAC.1